jgi:hypothetical protein
VRRRPERVTLHELDNLIDSSGVEAFRDRNHLLGVAAAIDPDPIRACLDRPTEHAAEVICGGC